MTKTEISRQFKCRKMVCPLLPYQNKIWNTVKLVLVIFILGQENLLIKKTELKVPRSLEGKHTHAKVNWRKVGKFKALFIFE